MKQTTDNPRPITLGSLFDGSGGFPLAGALNGAVPLWAAEIEPYPISVTRERFPQMQHLGSVTAIKGGEIPPVDIITFGSPCQDMSIAGKRAGMQHAAKGDEDTTRSGLFYEAIRIIREMRESTNGKYPTFAVWENVPGAFSSNKGEDFRCVLKELAQIAGKEVSIPQPAKGKWHPAGEIVGDGFSIAWRVLDAQYWGVPQRRKRIYLVADFADGCAGHILFECEGVPRHTEPGEAERQTASGDTGSCIDRSGQPCGGGYAQSVNCLNPWDAQSIRQYSPDGVFSSLNAGTGGGQNRAGVCYALQGNGIDRKIENGCNGKGFRENEMYTLDVVDRHAVVYEPKSAMDENWHEAEVKNAIRANASKSSHAIVYGIDPLSSNSMKSSNPHSGFHQQNVAKCLDTSDGNPSKNQGGMCVVYDTRGNGNGETVPTLTGDHQNRVTDYTAVCITAHELMDAEIAHNIDCIGAFVSRMGAKAGNIGFSSKTSPTLKACMSTEVAHTANVENSTGSSCVETHAIFRKYIVRRLTPLECCRLQGFPDGWGDTAKKDGFSEEEYRFWLAVRQTKESINGREPKHYTVAQMLAWYNKLHTDSAEYKMWGNGIALPCAVFVLGGVVEAMQVKQCENE